MTSLRFLCLLPAVFAVLSLQACAASPDQTAKSQYEDPRLPKTKEERDFMAMTTRAIYRLVPQDEEKFNLSLAARRNPVFPILDRSGNEVSHTEAVCERLAAYNVLGYANYQGSISIAVCENGLRVRELATQARSATAAVLKALSGKAPESINYYSRSTLEDGSEFFRLGNTGVLFNKSTERAVVVEISTSPMCDYGDQGSYKDSPLCRDLEGTFRSLAIAIERSVAKR
jgi:hypothetical protein